MAAPLEPDINPKNTDHHATTYSAANTTSSLKQTSADPVWEFYTPYSEYTSIVYVNICSKMSEYTERDNRDPC